MSMKTRMLVALGVTALALPATAVAGHNGHAHHPVTYIFKGAYAGDGLVSVAHGNAHARRGGFVGHDVSIDLSAARIVTADVNGDGKTDAADVQPGDVVIVKVRLPKRTTFSASAEADDATTLHVRQLIDITHPAVED